KPEEDEWNRDAGSLIGPEIPRSGHSESPKLGSEVPIDVAGSSYGRSDCRTAARREVRGHWSVRAPHPAVDRRRRVLDVVIAGQPDWRVATSDGDGRGLRVQPRAGDCKLGGYPDGVHEQRVGADVA